MLRRWGIKDGMKSDRAFDSNHAAEGKDNPNNTQRQGGRGKKIYAIHKRGIGEKL